MRHVWALGAALGAFVVWAATSALGGWIVTTFGLGWIIWVGPVVIVMGFVAIGYLLTRDTGPNRGDKK